VEVGVGVGTAEVDRDLVPAQILDDLQPSVRLRDSDGAAIALESIGVDAPGDDALGMDADQRLRPLDALGSSADLDHPRSPRVGGGEVIHHEGRPPRPGNVTELLGIGQVVPADVLVSTCAL
jgi:hypothetical protein